MFKSTSLMFLFCVVVFAGVVTVPAQRALTSSRNNLKSGAVYILTNQVANSVIAFSRDPKTGSLTVVDTQSTGGAGNPIAMPGDPPTDALASQGALAVDDGHNYLYAVNAGSNEISVLAIKKSGLELVQKIPSGGTRPISLAIYGDWVYVLNEGGTPNITGFSVADNGTLSAIDGSVQPLIGGTAADPAEVGFNQDGTLLVVTEKAGNRIDTYAVDENGVAGPPHATSSHGLTPFGFAFGGENNLFVSEANGGAAGGGAASSYRTEESIVDLQSGSIRNGQTAPCWLVTTNAGTYSFTSNTGSGTVSSFKADEDGVLRSVDGAAAITGAGSFPIDMVLSVNSRFLYVLESGSHTVSAWSVGKGGSLTPIGKFGALPIGAQGIAAK